MKILKSILLNDKFILGLIIVNSFIIFLQGFDYTLISKQLLYHIDNLITLIFVFELIIKIIEHRFSEFIKSGWNIFDSILIILALPSLYFWAFGNGISRFDFLLVLRIARIFKFFRFIKFIPNVNQLINGIQRALKASILVLFGFFIYNFIISVLSCFIYKNIAPEYFSNPVLSFYSIFKIFTVEGWYEIPDFIAKNSNQTIGILTKIYFIVILITGGIFGLSLVNSIFVDAMVSDNNDELERKVGSLENKIDQLLNNQKKL